jgi:hypothetical protein
MTRCDDEDELADDDEVVEDHDVVVIDVFDVVVIDVVDVVDVVVVDVCESGPVELEPHMFTPQTVNDVLRTEPVVPDPEDVWALVVRAVVVVAVCELSELGEELVVCEIWETCDPCDPVEDVSGGVAMSPVVNCPPQAGTTTAIVPTVAARSRKRRLEFVRFIGVFRCGMGCVSPWYCPQLPAQCKKQERGHAVFLRRRRNRAFSSCRFVPSAAFPVSRCRCAARAPRTRG